MRKFLTGLSVALLAGCAAQPSPQTQAEATRIVGQVDIVAQQVRAACAEAVPLAGLAGAIPVVGGYVAAGVVVGCNTDAGLARLTADPHSVVWLGMQIQILKNALHRRA